MMLRLAADENFDGRILRALLRQVPDLDVIRVQDTHLRSADDPTVLQWASEENRIVLTHDVSTLIGYAYDRAAEEKLMPGVIAVKLRNRPIALIVEDLELLIRVSEPFELEGRILFVPL